MNENAIIGAAVGYWVAKIPGALVGYVLGERVPSKKPLVIGRPLPIVPIGGVPNTPVASYFDRLPGILKTQAEKKKALTDYVLRYRYIT